MSRAESICTADDDGDTSRYPLVIATNQKPLYVDKNTLMKSRVYTPKRIGHPIRVNSCVRDCDPSTVHCSLIHYGALIRAHAKMLEMFLSRISVEVGRQQAGASLGRSSCNRVHTKRPGRDVAASSQPAGGNERDGERGGESGRCGHKCHDKLMFEGTIKKSP